MIIHLPYSIRDYSGIVCASLLSFLYLESGGEKEECNQEKAPAKLLRAAKVAGKLELNCSESVP